MATEPEFQGRGFGAKLLEASIGYVAQQKGNRLWCTARIPASGFYRSRGFGVEGGEFEVKNAGPHYFMCRPVQESDKAFMDLFSSS